MAKRKRQDLENHQGQPQSKKMDPASNLFTDSNALDPVLTSLFDRSSGPVTVPGRHSTPRRTSDKSRSSSQIASTKGLDDETTSSDSSESEPENNEDTRSKVSNELDSHKYPVHERKRKRNADLDDVESNYMLRLLREDAVEEDRLKAQRRGDSPGIPNAPSGLDEVATNWDEHGSLPQHETLVGEDNVADQSKAARTVFLGNVSTDAIKSKSARKTLILHLKQFLQNLPEHDPPHNIESIRFRSTAYDVKSGPKKAGYVKKDLMDATTRSANAYVVFSTEIASREAAAALNGTVVLERHLRVDHVANASVAEYRKCIFVGNLGLVNEETNDENKKDGSTHTPRRKKAKEPADIEEGLWRTFGQVGTVENVRVVRDKATRVGKGFAYVQFKDENAVEAALLYNDQKFPPLLPRKLRVSRARRVKKNDSDVNYRNETRRSKASLGKSPMARKPVAAPNGGKFVFEGYRASSSDGKTKLKGRGGKSKSPKWKPSRRSSRRGAAFKAGGRKKTRDK